jgi:GNAT superfamily N-acetyltransferase
MADKATQATPDDLQASYSIIAYQAKDLPPQYKNMVLSKWKRSLRHGNDYFKLVDSDHFYWAYDKYIGMLMHRQDAVIRLAVLSDDKDVVLGWSMTRGDCLDYVWVDPLQRNKGIATDLVPTTTKSFTHMTKHALPIWQKKLSHATFRPFN